MSKESFSVETLGTLPVDFIQEQTGLEGGTDLRKAMLKLRSSDRSAWDRLVFAIASRTCGARNLYRAACLKYDFPGCQAPEVSDKLS